jgi:hypothetical protein
MDQAMRTALLALLIFVSTFLNAQSWCPPGATWTYDSEMYTAGFIRMTYTHDTLIGGDIAQVIDRYTATQLPQPPPEPHFSGPPFTSYDPVVMITKLDSGVVYVLSGASWDTLYWFDAVPGDHWWPPSISAPDCDQLVVGDTGTDVLDGVALHWIRFNNTSYKIYERLGWTWSMGVYCPNWIIDGPMPMRCYHDDEIDVNFTQAPCEALVGMDEGASGVVQLIFPNPGTDHFTLQSPPGPNTITMHDALGRSVLVQRTTGGNVEIDASDLPPGTYLVRTITASGSATHAKWIKQ